MQSKKVFWCKVFFEDFVSHFIGMSDREIAKDVRDSIVSLSRRESEGESFGSKMVRMSNERVASKAASASRENGSRGGRPPRIPTKQEFEEYVDSVGLDYSDARQWFEMTVVERAGKDREGNYIRDWKAAVVGFCESKKEKRRKTA